MRVSDSLINGHDHTNGTRPHSDSPVLIQGWHMPRELVLLLELRHVHEIADLFEESLALF